MKLLDSTIKDLVLCGYWSETKDILMNRENFTEDESNSYIRSILLGNIKIEK